MRGPPACVHSGGIESQSLTPPYFFLSSFPWCSLHPLSLSPQTRPPFYLQAGTPSFYPQACPPLLTGSRVPLAGLELRGSLPLLIVL